MKKYTQDAFKNLVTGLGTSKDRATNGEWEALAYDGATLANAYSCDWLVQQLVNIPANEAVRGWRKITTPSMTPEQRELFEETERKLKIKARNNSALKWSALFGGGGIYISVEGHDPIEELVIESIPVGTEVNFIVLDRNEITPMSVYDSEFTSLYRTPATYLINRTGVTIDGSRFIRFNGIELPVADWIRNNYWDASAIQPILPDVERCETVSHALTQLIDEANVDVISVEGLFAKLANAQGASDVRARFAEGEIIKTLYNVQLLDAGETYNRHELSGSMAGLIQLLGAFYEKPAAARGIPVTKLLGISPGGLNATGESDQENFYDMIGTIREEEVASSLEVSDAVINQTLFGRQFDDWSYEWTPLWQMPETEKSDVVTKMVNNLLNLHDRGIFTPGLVARQLHDEGIFSALDDEYVDDIEGLDDIDEPDVEAEEADKQEVKEQKVESGSQPDDVSKEALNGAQMAQASATVEKMNAGLLTRSQAVGILTVSFPSLSSQEIETMVGTEQDIAETRENATTVNRATEQDDEVEQDEPREDDAERS